MISFATSNANKLREARMLLGFRVRQLRLDIDEVQSMSVRHVAELKAEQAYAKARSPVFVEDTALSIAGMRGFPGPLVKWVAAGIGYEGICRLADGAPGRSALAETCVAYRDGSRARSFTGRLEGTIAMHPQGRSFGWDCLFIPRGMERTFAQMTPGEKNGVSHRGVAFRKFRGFLKGNGLV